MGMPRVSSRTSWSPDSRRGSPSLRGRARPARQIDFERVVSSATEGGVGLLLDASSGALVGDFRCRNCEFRVVDENGNAVKVISSGSGPESGARGIGFDQSVFYGSDTALWLDAHAGGVIREFFVDSCQFDGYTHRPVRARRAFAARAQGTGSHVESVVLNSNWMVNYEESAVVFASENDGVVSDNAINSGYMGRLSDYAIHLFRTKFTSVRDVRLVNVGDSDGTAIWVTGGQGNIVSGVTHHAEESQFGVDFLVRILEQNAKDHVVKDNVGEAVVCAAWVDYTNPMPGIVKDNRCIGSCGGQGSANCPLDDGHATTRTGVEWLDARPSRRSPDPFYFSSSRP